MNAFLSITITLGSIGLVILMAWSLWSLNRSPLNPVQRIWWMFAILILPGVGSLAWMWWILRYYPRRKLSEPDWEPGAQREQRYTAERPRPSRGRYRHPAD